MVERLKLTPKTNELMEKILGNEKVIEELVNGFGSPLNILIPQNFQKNVNQIQEVLENKNLRNTIYFAQKANKSKAVLESAKRTGIGIDVASPKELEHALNKGFKGEEILGTGPKNEEFIRSLVLQDAIISVDSLSELEKLGKICQETEKNSKVLLRFSGFAPHDREKSTKNSRFGIDIEDDQEAIQELENHDSLEFTGLAFHLNTLNKRKKRIALQNLFHLFESFHEAGMTPKVFDIGGSIALNYLESKEEWNNYLESIQKAVIDEELSLTWNNHNFGLKSKDGEVQGEPGLFPYYNEGKQKYLREILETEIPSYGSDFASLLQDYMIELYLEPGKALLDQVGLTAAKVNFRKETGGESIIGLEMNKSNLSSDTYELMVDPKIISAKDRNENDEVYFAGNLCLESDFIYSHKTFLDAKVEEEDIVVFINTGAYHMDFDESRRIKQPIAEKVAVYTEKDQIKWKKDSLYRGN